MIWRLVMAIVTASFVHQAHFVPESRYLCD